MAKLLWNCFFTFKKKPLTNDRKHCDSRCNDSTEFFEYVNISAISKHIWKYFSKRVLYSKEIMKKRDQKSPHTVPIKSLKLSVYITDFDEWRFPFNNSCSQQNLFSLDRFVLVKIKLRHSELSLIMYVPITDFLKLLPEKVGNPQHYFIDTFQIYRFLKTSTVALSERFN